jgi:ubiquinone/menaquinone biosynthesis C-methylase UbiE
MADVRDSFGPVAARYATSKVHNNPAEFQRLLEIVNPRRTDRVLDVATGAGNAAFAFAPRVAAVVSYDLTVAMLDHVRRTAEEQGITNVSTQLGDACDIKVAPGSFDIVIARLAPHHFQSVPGFVAGAFQALRAGGKLLVVDTSSPEDDAIGAEIDAIEILRDPSHAHNLSHREWRSAFEGVGFTVTHIDDFADWPAEHGSKMDFDLWVERINTPRENRGELRRRFLEASPALTEALKIERIGAAIAFQLPRITILGVRG